VALGRIFHPIDKSFVRFSREILESKGELVPFKQGPYLGFTLLDDLT
jgi:hypothetical protein